jgi:uncharacterized protein (DUF39 family)
MTRAIAVRSTRIVFAAMILFGCSGESPTAPGSSLPSASPAPTTQTSAFLWGMVIDTTGACVADATIEVVRGQRSGERITQVTPCGAWDYDGGFVFNELITGAEMTLRASASGWSTEEKTFIPHAGTQQAVFLTLSRI